MGALTVYKHICQEELGLSAGEQRNLVRTAKLFLDEWNKLFSSKRFRNSNDTYHGNAQHEIASTFYESGWKARSGKVRKSCIPPGKTFWQTSDRGIVNKKLYILDLSTSGILLC